MNMTGLLRKDSALGVAVSGSAQSLASAAVLDSDAEPAAADVSTRVETSTRTEAMPRRETEHGEPVLGIEDSSTQCGAYQYSLGQRELVH
jgi:hypothetical protein